MVQRSWGSTTAKATEEEQRPQRWSRRSQSGETGAMASTAGPDGPARIPTDGRVVSAGPDSPAAPLQDTMIQRVRRWSGLVIGLIGTSLTAVLCLGVLAFAGFDRAIDEWHRQAEVTTSKPQALEHLQVALGFGGLIHSYGELALDQDRAAALRAEKSVREARAAMRAYREAGMTLEEAEALAILGDALERYEIAVAVLAAAARSGLAPLPLHAVPTVDGTAAVAAMQVLLEATHATVRQSVSGTSSRLREIGLLAVPALLLMPALVLAAAVVVWLQRRLVATFVAQARMEQEARQSRTHLARAQAMARLGSFDIELATSATAWSAEALRILGLSEDEAARGPEALLGAVHPDDRGTVSAALRDAEERGSPFRIDYRVLRPDGSERTVRHEGELKQDSGSASHFIMCTIQDVTERIATERELYLRTQAMDAANTGIVITGPLGQDCPIIYVNPAFERLTGYSLREVAGKNCRLLQGEDTDDVAITAMRDAVTAASPVTVTTRNYRKDGSAFWNEITLAPVLDGHGVATHFIGVQTDVSALKQAQIDLQEQLAFSRTLIDTIPIPVFFKGIDGRFLGCNQAFAALVGLPTHEIIGRTIHDLRLPELADRTREEELTLLRSGAVRTYRQVVPQADGRHRREAVTKALFRKPDGEIGGIVGAILDLTEREEAEQRFRILSRAIEQSAATVVISDADGAIQYVNGAFVALTGYTEDEVIGQNPRILKSGETLDRTYEALWRTISHGEIWRGELLNRKKNGELFWEFATIGPVFASDGTITHYVAVKEDITERKLYEEKLRLSEQRFKDFASASSDWFYELGPDLRFTWFSDQLEGRAPIGLPIGRIIGRTRREIAANADDDAFWAPHLANLAAHRPFRDFVYPVTRADGSVTHIRVSGIPVFDADGTFLGYRGTAADITAQVQAETEAARARGLLQDAVESIADGFAIYDADDRLVLFNSHYAEALAVVQEFLKPGTAFADLLTALVHCGGIRIPEGEMAEAWIRARLEERKADRVQRAFQTGDGGFVEVDEYRIPSGGRTMIRRDVSQAVLDAERRQALERELQQTHKMESIGQLAGGIAHEINTPIQYIGDNLSFIVQGTIDLLEVLAAQQRMLADAEHHGVLSESMAAARAAAVKADLDFLVDELPSAARQSLEGVEHVARIVRAMKEFSYPSTREKVLVDLNHTLENTLTVSRNEWKYVAEVERVLDPELPHVLCLPGDLSQVFLNLIVNAAHAIDAKNRKPADAATGAAKGRITLTTRKDGDCVEVRVQDTGTGVPEAIRRRIFDPFFTTKEVGKGTGQGLTIARDIVVTKHGGTLTFETSPGEGTTFIVRLPIRQSGAERQAA
ncbi:MAG: PAS domain S-box protein [Rhodospirillales bacterium]|nr:MAG: PAS domain S-box protein [Rhodospirillales bacterium]